MHSASPRQVQSHGASPRTTPPAAVSALVRCRRLNREVTLAQASQLFQNGNMSCGLCGEGNAGQFPCQQGIRKK